MALWGPSSGQSPPGPGFAAAETATLSPVVWLGCWHRRGSWWRTGRRSSSEAWAAPIWLVTRSAAESCFGSCHQIEQGSSWGCWQTEEESDGGSRSRWVVGWWGWLTFQKWASRLCCRISRTLESHDYHYLVLYLIVILYLIEGRKCPIQIVLRLEIAYSIEDDLPLHLDITYRKCGHRRGWWVCWILWSRRDRWGVIEVGGSPCGLLCVNNM